MATILEEIVEDKIYDVERKKLAYPLSQLEKSEWYKRKSNSLVKNLNSKGSSGIIAEFKRKSPSKGNINIGVGIAETVKSYEKNGAAALSILTDTNFFGGFLEDLKIGRENCPNMPILRKDFIIDSYQIHESKAWGADVILLIAACLSPKEVESFSKLAHKLGLEVLLEVHDKLELANFPLKDVDIIGVNNRNLKNFNENDVKTSIELSKLIPKEKLKISESCISEPKTVKELKSLGYNGFLIGELFMRSISPGESLKVFIDKI